MFYGAGAFNGDLSKWDVSRLKDMTHMFYNAYSFNGDLSKWDVSSVKHMDAMFCNAAFFEQNICGAAWVYSKASKVDMFAGSSGSISPTACTSASTLATTQVTSHYATRRPLPERELVVHTPISTSVSTSTFTSMIISGMACPKCGTFAKSGRVSCCAPGGAWFKNCGGFRDRNVDHRWPEGVEVCKRKFKARSM